MDWLEVPVVEAIAVLASCGLLNSLIGPSLPLLAPPFPLGLTIVSVLLLNEVTVPLDDHTLLLHHYTQLAAGNILCKFIIFFI